ncbi:MAG TPA: proline racemase family protein [Rhodanobacteraceae bacterium]|nr:proline racemase family protein [Rhodanobacteraceae bacterium]
MQTLHVTDSHTAGEPTRVVLDGFPDVGNGPLAMRRELLDGRFGRWRSAVACEPRGSDTMVGALLTPPTEPGCCAGVIFFNNVGTLGMCGHGTIGVARTLAHLGRIAPGEHRIETPVGVVGVTLHEDLRVTVSNVESWRHAANVAVEVPGVGSVRGDIAWGGNWFFITGESPVPVEFGQIRALTAYTEAIGRALEAQGVTGENGARIDHVEVNVHPGDGGADSRNFVLCPGLAYDRSPCGTGTSAKLACLAANGELPPGKTWRQMGILGSAFDASYARGTRGVLPRITGSAWITGEATLLLDPDDPFVWGIGGDRPCDRTI